MEKMKQRLGWTIAVCCLLGGGVAHGSGSLDCTKATSKVEKLICGDEELLRLDAELARVYAKAMETITKKPETLSWKGRVKGADWRKWLTREQALWREDRDQCADTACVGKRYRQRISRISGKLGFEDEERQYSRKEDEETCLPPRTDWRNYQWTLIVGNGRTSCEEMLAFLKSRPKDAPPPVCPEERLPTNGNWTRPEWRELSDAEKETLLRGIPEKHQQKPKGPVSYEQTLAHAKRLRVIRADITRDGVPETLLTYSGEPWRTCDQSTRCAVTDSASFHEITLSGGDQYGLLPMNEQGTRVDWEHRLVEHLPQGGELVFYKGRPYWLSVVMWHQGAHDNFALYNKRPTDPWSNIFTLKPLHYGKSEGGDPNAPAEFNNLNYIISSEDDGCWFGYFHRDNLKQHPVRIRR